MAASPTAAPRYRQVAQRVTRLIEKGALKPGQRIPSIRKMSSQAGVAIATVIEAYRLLEDQGLVEARPQSGYYVRPPHMRGLSGIDAPPEPELKSIPLRAGPVRAEDDLDRHMNICCRPGVLQLGAALPAPEFLPTEALNRILAREVRRDAAGASAYAISPGLDRLRAQIARRTMDAGCSLGPDDIVITTGATEAMMLGLRAVTQPGDTVAVESPCYFGLLYLLRSLNLRAVEVSTDPRHGISLTALERLLAGKTAIKALVVNPNVHNPLGCVMPDENKRHIAELLGQRKIPIIEDDTYGDLAFQSPRPKNIHGLDRYDNVLLCGSYSKTLAPGYRIGWIAASRFRKAVHEMKLATTLGSATPPQLAVARFLANGGFDHHLRRLRRIYQEQLQLVSHAVLRSFPIGTRATRPAGGHILWVELPSAMDGRAMYEAALRNGISIAPGTIFSVRGRYANFLRLNAGIPWSTAVEAAIEKLGKLAAGCRKTN